MDLKLDMIERLRLSPPILVSVRNLSPAQVYVSQFAIGLLSKKKKLFRYVCGVDIGCIRSRIYAFIHPKSFAVLIADKQ